MQIFSFYSYFCCQSEAIHNKDYSVVKTFKAGVTSRFFFTTAIVLKCKFYVKK